MKKSQQTLSSQVIFKYKFSFLQKKLQLKNGTKEELKKQNPKFKATDNQDRNDNADEKNEDENNKKEQEEVEEVIPDSDYESEDENNNDYEETLDETKVVEEIKSFNKFILNKNIAYNNRMVADSKKNLKRN